MVLYNPFIYLNTSLIWSGIEMLGLRYIIYASRELLAISGLGIIGE